jgi:hypothetical protein
MSDLNKFTAVPEWVWHSGIVISSNARLVLIWYIYNGILESGWAQVRAEFVARSCGISTRTLLVKHRELEKAGLIRVVAGRNTSEGIRCPNKIIFVGEGRVKKP